MGQNSSIQWTDNTFNPWIGCTKVSPGCANCYAERDWDKRRHVAQWGPTGTRIVTSEANWKTPIRWDKQAEKSGTRTKVFCASLADVFEDWPGQVMDHTGLPLWEGNTLDDTHPMCLGDLRQRLFTLIDQTPHLDWQLLTKRPENIRRMWPTPNSSPCRLGDGSVSHDFISGRCRKCDGGHRRNVWLLTSVENQEQADQRIPELLKCRNLAPVLGLSCEPLLGPIEFSNVSNRADAIQQWGKRALSGLDWIIAGGESGPNARPMHPDWVRSIRDQCQAAEVPFFFKQWGEWSPWEPGDSVFWNVSRTNAIDRHAIPDLTDHKEHEKWWWPAHLDGSLVIYHRTGAAKAGALIDGQDFQQFPTPSCPPVSILSEPN